MKKEINPQLDKKALKLMQILKWHYYVLFFAGIFMASLYIKQLFSLNSITIEAVYISIKVSYIAFLLSFVFWLIHSIYSITVYGKVKSECFTLEKFTKDLVINLFLTGSFFICFLGNPLAYYLFSYCNIWVVSLASILFWASFCISIYIYLKRNSN